MKKCRCCNSEISHDNSPYGENYVENYGIICENCWNTDLFHACSNCQKYYTKEELIFKNDEYICKSCFKEVKQ